MSSYSELLKDPRWQKRRFELLERAEWKCARCGRKDKQLQVHHHVYRRGKLPWEYADHDFSVLCEPHHQEVTEFRDKVNEAIATYEKHELPMMSIVGYVNAFVSCAVDTTITANTAEEISGVAAMVGVSSEFVRKYRDVGSGVVDVHKLILEKAMVDHVSGD